MPEAIYAMKLYYVYMLTNRTNKVIYTGVTNDLARRIYEYKHKMIEGFTSRYNLDKLVYFESCMDVRSAIEKEKQIKGGPRSKKIALIEAMNPEWKDLSIDCFAPSGLAMTQNLRGSQ